MLSVICNNNLRTAAYRSSYNVLIIFVWKVQAISKPFVPRNECLWKLLN